MLKKEIPFFNYSALFAENENAIMSTLHDVLSRGAYIMQKDLINFEERVKNYIDVKHVLGVADGTNALLLSLYAAGIGHGDEVILCSHTYIATAASVHFAGAKPVLAECGPDHMIDPECVERLITDKTRAIMPTQLNGRTCNMDMIEDIAEKNKLIIIEDAAQAFGSKYKGKSAGTFGKAGTFSFYPAKLLGCFGDGGAVVTNDDDMAEKLFLLRDHGRNKDGKVVTWGTNCRLDNMQAAILNLKLKTFEKDIARRREIAAMYHHALHELEDLILPPSPDSNPNHFDVYQNYELESGNRDMLKAYLESQGVKTLIQWGGQAVHQCLGVGFEDVKLPVTEYMTSRFLMLPMHTALSDEDVAYICECIHNFYRNL